MLLDNVFIVLLLHENSFSADNNDSDCSGSQSGSRHRHQLLRHGLTLSEAEAKSQKQEVKKPKKRERQVQDLECVIGESKVFEDSKCISCMYSCHFYHPNNSTYVMILQSDMVLFCFYRSE